MQRKGDSDLVHVDISSYATPLVGHSLINNLLLKEERCQSINYYSRLGPQEHTGVPKPCEENQAPELSKFARLRKGAIHLLGPTKRKITS